MDNTLIQVVDNTFYVVGGTVPSEAPCYIVRRADFELHAGIREGRFCYVLTARQMGKSSLINRVAGQLRSESITVAQIDLTSIGHNLTIEQWYDGLLYELGKELGLKATLRDCWRAHLDLGPLHRFLTVLREGVLHECSGPVVIFVDEIEVVRNLGFSTDEFFAAIRECYNRRAHDPDLQRLTFCLVGMAAPVELIQDARITPFNIGMQIDLEDFTLEETACLAKGLQQKDEGKRGSILLKRVYYWTNGHPYLTQRLCHAVARDPEARSAADVDRICKEMFLSTRAREIDTNLASIRQYLLLGSPNPIGLLDLYGRIRAGKRVEDDRASALLGYLRLSGVVRVAEGRFLVRNHIYEQVFGPAWILSNMPGAELRRQRAAFRRGAMRSSVLLGSLLTVVSFLALKIDIAERQAHRLAVAAHAQALRADRHARETRDLLYSADMNLGQQADLGHNARKIRDLLAAHGSDEQRGFEWNYLWRQVNRERLLLQDEKDDQDALYSVAFTPEGDRLATAAADGIIRIWNPVTGHKEQSLHCGKSPVLAVAFSPDGKSLATGDADGMAQLQDWHADRPGQTVGVKIVAIRNGIAFSRDTYHCAVADGNRVRIRDLRRTSEPPRVIDFGQHITAIALSPDSRLLAVGGHSDVRIWEAATGRSVRRFPGFRDSVDAIAFSSDGTLLAAGSADSTAQVWSVGTGVSYGPFRGHSRAVAAVAISPNGRLLATGSDDDTARVWSIETGAETRVFMRQTGLISAVAFSPDGRQLASGSFDGTTAIWDLAPDPTPVKVDVCRSSLWRAVFSPNGKLFAARCLDDPDNPVQLWDARRWRRIATFVDRNHSVGTIAFSSDSARLAIGRTGLSLSICDAAGGHPLAGDPAAPLPVTYPLAFSSDGRWLAARTDTDVQIWDLRLHRLAQRLDNSNAALAAAFSPDSTRLAIVSALGHAQIHRLSGQEPTTLLQKEGAALQTVAFSRDGKTLVTGSDDGFVTLWNVASGRVTLTFDEKGAAIRAATFSEDNSLLISVDSEGAIHSWRAATNAEIAAGK